MLRDKNSEAITSELKDKIKSKMDVAKFFSGFISIFLGISLKEGDSILTSENLLQCIAGWASVSTIILSMLFSIATLFSLDRLLMPPELWKTPPDESFNLKLKKAMVNCWIKLFYLSIMFFLIGILLFIVAKTKLILLPLSIFISLTVITYITFQSLTIRREIHD